MARMLATCRAAVAGLMNSCRRRCRGCSCPPRSARRPPLPRRQRSARPGLGERPCRSRGGRDAASASPGPSRDRGGGRQRRRLRPTAGPRRAARVRPPRPGSAASGSPAAAAGGARAQRGHGPREPQRCLRLPGQHGQPGQRLQPAGHADPAAGRIAQPQALGQVLPGGGQVTLLERDAAEARPGSGRCPAVR